MWRCAFTVTTEFGIALPDYTTVLTIGMPDLGTIIFTAVSTDQFCGEWAVAVMIFAAGSPMTHFGLYTRPLIRSNDCFMAVFNIVLRNFTLVYLHLLLEKIHRKLLLKQCCTLVLFVGKNALNSSILPHLLAPGGGDSLLSQKFCNGITGFALHKQTVDQSDGFRFLRYDLRQTIGTLAVSKELTVGNADLAICKTLSLAPSDIFGDTTAFFLCKAGHDGDEQFTFAVQCPDVFFLKIHLNTCILQLADGGEAVDGVPGKATHALGHDQVDLTIQGILHHAVESVALLGVGGGDTLVSVDLHELPVGSTVDVFTETVFENFGTESPVSTKEFIALLHTYFQNAADEMKAQQS